MVRGGHCRPLPPLQPRLRAIPAPRGGQTPAVSPTPTLATILLPRPAPPCLQAQRQEQPRAPNGAGGAWRPHPVHAAAPPGGGVHRQTRRRGAGHAAGRQPGGVPYRAARQLHQPDAHGVCHRRVGGAGQGGTRCWRARGAEGAQAANKAPWLAAAQVQLEPPSLPCLAYPPTHPPAAGVLLEELKGQGVAALQRYKAIIIDEARSDGGASDGEAWLGERGRPAGSCCSLQPARQRCMRRPLRWASPHTPAATTNLPPVWLYCDCTAPQVHERSVESDLVLACVRELMKEHRRVGGCRVKGAGQGGCGRPAWLGVLALLAPLAQLALLACHLGCTPAPSNACDVRPTAPPACARSSSWC